MYIYCVYKFTCDRHRKWMQVCRWHHWLSSHSTGLVSLVLWFPTSPLLTGVYIQRKQWLSFEQLLITSLFWSTCLMLQPQFFLIISWFLLQTDMDSTNLYAYISIIALIVCIPPALIVSKTLPKTPFWYLFMNLIKYEDLLYWSLSKFFVGCVGGRT